MYKKTILGALLLLLLAACAGENTATSVSEIEGEAQEELSGPYADLKAPELPKEEQRAKRDHPVAGKYYARDHYMKIFEYYYLLDDGRFIYSLSPDEYKPSLYTGEWEVKGDKIHFKTQRHYYGKPNGKEIPTDVGPSSYEDYVMRVENSSEEMEPLIVEDVLKVGQPLNNPKRNIHLSLQNIANPERKEMAISTRPLQPSELKDKSLEELSLMRNEVFAAYGYKFKDERLKAHFKAQGYQALASDVTAFLSPLEKDNIALIKKVEAIKAK
ncbi:YARHG domain-containing protein [Saprospira grandis]|uniref:YARHG domain-containing protein n=1 Tax=Saprospira grandis TaxID=1008 RepID=UPI0022DD4209|nr:YARHG domain-containing protein [Saprospira grandis]WBM74206.1 YARHG domain-containing protein [Saprospira grandis]